MITTKKKSQKTTGGHKAPCRKATPSMPPGLTVTPDGATMVTSGAELSGGQLSKCREANSPVQAGKELSDEGQLAICQEAALPMPLSLDSICNNLINLRRDDYFLIRAGSRETLAIKSYIRSKCGWRYMASKAENKAPKAESEQAYKKLMGVKVRKNPMSDARFNELGLEILKPRAIALREIEKQRDVLEKSILELAKQLPAFKWSESIRGFGALSLARVVGEAGNLSAYHSRDALVKYLGVAPTFVYLKRTKKGKYVPLIPKKIRSVMYVIGDNLLRLKNPVYDAIYREQHARRRKLRDAEFTAKPKKKGLKGHLHFQAHRAMERTFIRDLYAAWHADVK